MFPYAPSHSSNIHIVHTRPLTAPAACLFPDDWTTDGGTDPLHGHRLPTPQQHHQHHRHCSACGHCSTTDNRMRGRCDNCVVSLQAKEVAEWRTNLKFPENIWIARYEGRELSQDK